MNKETVEVKRDFCKAQMEYWSGRYKERVAELTEAAELEAQLAEPELRHGDIRGWSLNSTIGIVDLSEPAPHMIWPDGDKRNSKTEHNILSQSKSIGNLKDIFADLKAMQEPLEKFRLDKVQYKIADTGEIAFGVPGVFGEYIAMKDFPAFILNLHRLYATAMRAEKSEA